MAIDANQPDEFFPFLARYVSSGGPRRCDGIEPDENGALTFKLTKGAESISVRWSITRRMKNEAPYRDGSVTVVSPGRSLRNKAAAISQLTARLDSLFEKHKPLLIEKRNRETETIIFGAETIGDLCGRLLSPGYSKCGAYTYEGVGLDGDSLRAVFTGAGGKFELYISRGERASAGTVFARPGPFVLSASPETLAAEPRLRAAKYFAYVLALGVNERMRFISAAQAAATAELSSAAGGRKQYSYEKELNPFFFSESLDEINLFNALFACEGRLAVITHFDRECTHYFNYLNGPVESFNFAPWKVRPGPDYLRRYRTTDTNDLDAVMTGCEERFAALVRDAALVVNPQLIFVIDSCVAKIIGDDIAGVLAELAPELGGAPVVRMEVTLGPPENFRWLWQRLIEIFQKRQPGPNPNASVNLIGYGHARTRGLAELRGLLETAGVRVNTCLMPTFNLDELPNYGNAALNVMYPASQVRDAFRYAAPLCSAPIFESPAPFGFAGTLGWLNAILRELGKEPISNDRVYDLTGEAADSWSTLMKEAESYRAAVVLRDDHFTSESSPLDRFGVPWLSCLDEMGFGLDLLVLRSDDAARVGKEQQDKFDGLARGFQRPEAHRIIRVESEAALAGAIEAGDFQIVYTELFRDRRITAAGKVPFSIMDFEMGFGGAVRTLERLLGYCRAPFFSRYHKYIKTEAVIK